MPLPKKLMPTHEREILDEISKELDLPLNAVKKTYNIWLDYLESISIETDQSTINFSGLGKMYISYTRMKGIRNKKWREKKIKKIESDIPGDKINDHKSIVPINIIYGVGRKNHKIGRNNKGMFDFFTKEELIRRQNNAFFKEDFEFNDRIDVYNNYFSDIDEQKVIEYEKNMDNNKS